eukprot:maker-scaffold697_size109876-snap-gene-0.18 protein:Tk05844 transcript:maker-scaffold697_size109876-snap-gene-0.18-mRNA-1 annotation:"hypothetical protein BRAFLDRAFT_79146"
MSHPGAMTRIWRWWIWWVLWLELIEGLSECPSACTNAMIKSNSVLERLIQHLDEVEQNQTSVMQQAWSRPRDGPVVSPSTIRLLPEGYDKRQFPPQEIMLEVRLSHYWFDTRLDINFNKPIELDPEAIGDFWSPDSYFHHAKDSKTVSLVKKPASLRINPDKMIKYTMMTMVTIGCPMSFHMYPMDQQTCRLELQSFGYSLLYNNYTWRRAPFIKQDSLLDNHNAKIAHYEFTYSNDGLKYPGLGIRIELRRYLGYHITQTYIPSVIYVAVAWLSFVVPSDIVPGRMVLCVTTLLTLNTMFNSVRNITPQASYMKAIDLWVFVCILFVFSALAEYGYILHLTSRSAWQKRVDSHVRGRTGKAKLKTINPVHLLSVTMEKEAMGNLHPDQRSKRADVNEDARRHIHVISSHPSPKVVNHPDWPTDKERLAYTIEWLVKIVYPVCFAIFNIAYWSVYMKQYSTEPNV